MMPTRADREWMRAKRSASTPSREGISPRSCRIPPCAKATACSLGRNLLRTVVTDSPPCWRQLREPGTEAEQVNYLLRLSRKIDRAPWMKGFADAHRAAAE